jgi:DNA-binding NarL/FixJ family response regulator
MIRVLVVDDHSMVRTGLERLLYHVPDIEMIGGASSGEDAIRQVEAYAPDVVLMDIAMPGLNGVDATRTIVGRHPGIKVIMVSTFDDQRDVAAALDAGASGYLMKDVEPEALVSGIRSVLTGGVPLSPSVAARVVGSRGQPASAPLLLTKRETDVLTLIVEGCSNKQIARTLGISEKTVKTHCGRLFRRIGVHDRTQAAVWAERHLARHTSSPALR